jgi:hypothetical protein
MLNPSNAPTHKSAKFSSNIKLESSKKMRKKYVDLQREVEETIVQFKSTQGMCAHPRLSSKRFGSPTSLSRFPVEEVTLTPLLDLPLLKLGAKVNPTPVSEDTKPTIGSSRSTQEEQSKYIDSSTTSSMINNVTKENARTSDLIKDISTNQRVIDILQTLVDADVSVSVLESLMWLLQSQEEWKGEEEDSVLVETARLPNREVIQEVIDIEENHKQTGSLLTDSFAPRRVDAFTNTYQDDFPLHLDSNNGLVDNVSTLSELKLSELAEDEKVVLDEVRIDGDVTCINNSKFPAAALVEESVEVYSDIEKKEEEEEFQEDDKDINLSSPAYGQKRNPDLPFVPPMSFGERREEEEQFMLSTDLYMSDVDMENVVIYNPNPRQLKFLSNVNKARNKEAETSLVARQV